MTKKCYKGSWAKFHKAKPNPRIQSTGLLLNGDLTKTKARALTQLERDAWQKEHDLKNGSGRNDLPDRWYPKTLIIKKQGEE